MPRKIGGLFFQLDEPINQRLVVIVIPQNKMKMTSGTRLRQLNQPMHRKVHGPKNGDSSPTEIKNVAAEDERFRMRRRSGNLFQIPVGVRTIGEQVQIGNKETLRHAIIIAGRKR